MPLNPLQGGFVPTDAALEHQEATRQDQAQQTNKAQDRQTETPVNNPANIHLFSISKRLYLFSIRKRRPKPTTQIVSRRAKANPTKMRMP
jgi:hypothetical protein